MSWRCEKRRSGVFRVDLSVVEGPEFDGIEIEALGHLVHRDLKRHESRRLAGGAHRVPFRQIEHGEPRRYHTVGTGIQQARLVRSSFGGATGEIAGPRLVSYSGDFAVALGAYAQRAGSSRAMRSVVRNNMRTAQRDFDGPAQ